MPNRRLVHSALTQPPPPSRSRAGNIACISRVDDRAIFPRVKCVRKKPEQRTAMWMRSRRGSSPLHSVQRMAQDKSDSANALLEAPATRVPSPRPRQQGARLIPYLRGPHLTSARAGIGSPCPSERSLSVLIVKHPKLRLWRVAVVISPCSPSISMRPRTSASARLAVCAEC